MLAILDEAFFTLLTSEQGPQDWRHFQNALLKVDCLGTLKYGQEAFHQAANSRFASKFDYTQELSDAVTMQGWGGCEAAKSFAQIQMMNAPAGPDNSLDLQLILEGTALEEFADCFFEGQVDVNNMHDLRVADLFAMGMDVHQASSFHLYISQHNGEVWPVGFVLHMSDSDTESYDSVWDVPE
jgi:hypothetical protein